LIWGLCGYDSLGHLTNPPTGNRIGFAGKAYEETTGLSYLGARYYRPSLGRFISVDPKGFDDASKVRIGKNNI
jgi:RHS repeat-associated protein